MIKTRGFTLLETLIALLIFSLIGLAITIGLRSVLTSYHRLTAAQEFQQKLNLFSALIRQDINAIINSHSVNGNKEQLRFFRTDLATTIHYQCQQNTLRRLSYKKNTLLEKRTLLTQVKRCNFSYISNNGLDLIWPSTQPSTQLLGINIDLNLSGHGTISLLALTELGLNHER